MHTIRCGRHIRNHDSPETILRLKQLAPRLHALGEAPIFHFLSELAAGADLLPTLERYARLPAEFIRVSGGARLSRPLMAIAGGRH